MAAHTTAPAPATCKITLHGDERCGDAIAWEITWKDLGGRTRSQRTCDHHFKTEVELVAMGTWDGSVNVHKLG